MTGDQPGPEEATSVQRAPLQPHGKHEVLWCFHTTAMVADYDVTRDALARLAGSRVLEENWLDDPAIGRRGGMTWIGDNSIELGEPIIEGGAVDRFIKQFGSHMSSIAVQVADIDATIAHLGTRGVRVASRIDDVIVFTDPRTTAGVVVEWYGSESENDPRFGTPIPPYSVTPLLEVTRMAFGGAVVDDPPAAAEHLAGIMGTTVTFVNPDAPPGSPTAGVSLLDMTLALYPIPDPEASERLWGHAYRRPQTNNLGVLVPDLGTALTALVDAGIRLVRHDEQQIVIHPDATGGVVLVVVDQLLPGDPRQTNR
jgi:catechol 2,3-dioxygenase-like lactoylglutathione lyase family enzyme